MDKFTFREDAVQIPAGYVVAVGGGSTPLWIADMTGWMEMFAVLFAVLVGATTLYINIQNIMEKRAKRRAEKSIQ